MKLYHKVFKSHADMSVYLANMDPLISYDEELLNRLTNARNTDELYDAKCSILRDFRDIYAFDASEAEFPEPIGHFDDEEEKIKFIRKKILLQDIAFYLGSVYKKYHSIIYQTHNRLPEIELKRLAIDYNEIYRKAMEDYIATLVTGGQHAVTASFVLPSLIEQGLGMALQNRMLFKCIMQLNDLTEEEKKIIKPFLHNDKVLFYGTEKFAMEKLYRVDVVANYIIDDELGEDSVCKIECRDGEGKTICSAEISFRNGNGHEGEEGLMEADEDSEYDTSELEELREKMFEYIDEKLNPYPEKLDAYVYENKGDNAWTADFACSQCGKFGVSIHEEFLPIGRCCYCGWDNELEKCDRCGQLVDVDVLENGLCPSCSAYIDKQ